MVEGDRGAFIVLIRGYHRIPLLAQSPKAFDLSGYVRFWIGQADPTRGSIKVQIDIDPQSFF